MRLPNISAPIVRETKTEIDINCTGSIQQQGLEDINPKDLANCFSKLIIGGTACLLSIKRKNKGEFNRQCRDQLIQAGGDCAKIAKQISKD